MTPDTPDTTDLNVPLADLRKLREFPDVTPTDCLVGDQDEVMIHHTNGDRTRVLLTTRDDGLAVAGIVWFTSNMPDVTPADDVHRLGDTVHIIHGPGRETRVTDV